MKILLVEDDQDTRDLLTAILGSHHYVVDAIADGPTALSLVEQWPYDLILLDILLPSLSGIEVCRQLRAQACQTPILMLTVKDSNEDVIAGLDAGADDYVAKSCESSQLLARVRALLRRRGSVEASPILSWGDLSLDPVSAQVTYQQQAIPLRPKEYNLLELFLRHPQRIFSRSAIIDHLWSMDDPPIEASITNLIKDLRGRLKTAGMTTDLIETVYGLGYRLKSIPSEAASPQKAPSKGASPTPTSTPHSDEYPEREHRGVAMIQKITQRFQVSLDRRIVALEGIGRSLQASPLTAQQQQEFRREIHKLAGGLGTFGYTRASEIAQEMEALFDDDLNPCLRVDQFTPLLAALKQELTHPLMEAPTA